MMNSETRYNKFDGGFEEDERNLSATIPRWFKVECGTNKWRLIAVLVSIFATIVTILAIVAFAKLQQAQDDKVMQQSQIMSLKGSCEVEEPQKNCSELFKVKKLYDFYVLSSTCKCEVDNCTFAPSFGNVISTSQFLVPYQSMENHTVTIKATPTTNSPWPTVDFKPDSSETIYFHMSVRISSRLVVRNSYLDNRWDAEERLLDGLKYPFSVGREFKMDISVDTEAFHVYVDDQHIFDFNHRHRPISNIKFLDIDDKFDLKEITFN